MSEIYFFSVFKTTSQNQNLRGQFRSLQSEVSNASPLQSSAFVELHVLSLVLEPSPHVALQADHSNQVFHSATKYKSKPASTF